MVTYALLTDCAGFVLQSSLFTITATLLHTLRSSSISQRATSESPEPSLQTGLTQSSTGRFTRHWCLRLQGQI